MPSQCQSRSASRLSPATRIWREAIARSGVARRQGRRRRISRKARAGVGTGFVTGDEMNSALDAFDIMALPGGHPEWVVPGGHAAPIERFSATSLNALLGCPLQWVLRYRAGIRTGGHALPPLFLLNGTLGHRLVENLHAQGAFDLKQIPNNKYKLAMSVGASRKYGILEIVGRHFIETAQEAGLGATTIKAVLTEILEAAPNAAATALSEMPADFHPAIHESIAKAIDARLPRLETALASIR